ncbi:Fc.00g061550.m01.CDS01 [Cosmosporella sp. VM-42]
MAIREDLVASAAQFLQDPSVASSSVENRVTFLRSKNLTQEEIDVALARAGGNAPPAPSGPYPGAPPQPVQQYYQQYPQHAWQPPPPPPRRDWRDWFIMATVVGGVGYGLYSLGKRYVYPLVAPPTPEKLEQDKKSIEEQFDKAFALVEQLAQDTEALKNAEQERTEKLDNAITELESVMADLKAANRRREDDAQRIRDEVQGLKDAIPKAMDNQKQLTDNRLREINTELSSLKTLVSQRMTPSAASTSGPGHYVRQSSGNVTPQANRSTSAKVEDAEETTSTKAAEPSKTLGASSFSRTSTLPSGGAKASIPAWQMAMANKNTGTSAATNGEESKEAGSSSSP